jgi:hypothetical protein
VRQVTASVVPSSPILVTLMKEALSSSESSDLTRATRRNIPEDAILHSHRRENLKPYIALTGWTLYRRRYVSPVKYELDFYIPEDAVLYSHRRENLKSYTLSLCSSLTVRDQVSHPRPLTNGCSNFTSVESHFAAPRGHTRTVPYVLLCVPARTISPSCTGGGWNRGQDCTEA